MRPGAHAVHIHRSNAALADGENVIEVTLNTNDHSEWTHAGEHITATLTHKK